WLDLEGHVRQGRAVARTVAKRDLIELDLPARLIEMDSLRLLIDHHGKVHVLENPLEERERADDVDLQVRQRAHRTIEASQQDGRKSDDRAQRFLTGHHEVAAKEPEHGGTGRATDTPQ